MSGYLTLKCKHHANYFTEKKIEFVLTIVSVWGYDQHLLRGKLLKNHNNMWCIICNIACCFLNFLGWATLIESITFLMNNTLHTMILNCFIKWCSIYRVIFCLIDALKKWKTGKLFHHCDTLICEVFCHLFFDTSIKGKKNIKQKKKHL